MSIVYLLLGSNLGDRKENIEKAIVLIQKRIGKIQTLSPIYETEPWGFKEKADNFYNQGMKVNTPLSSLEVLTRILEIEKDMGRTRNTIEYESRTIDIDILFYNKDIIKTETLTIPHPGIPERLFVLEILCEIAPDFVHPALNKNIKILRDECTDDKKVWYLE